MAVMEHAYYASFGYQVTSFFAASRQVFMIAGIPKKKSCLLKILFSVLTVHVLIIAVKNKRQW